MTHSNALKELLFFIRQHPAFPELLRAVPRPDLPRYRKSEKITIEQIGTEFLFASGQDDQHARWRHLLTGSPQNGDNDNPV